MSPTVRVWMRPIALCLLLPAVGCGGDDSPADAPCSGHGHLHADHCHCDPGYAPSADGLACVEGPAGADAGRDADPGVPDAEPAERDLGVAEPDADLEGSDAAPGGEPEPLAFDPAEARGATGRAEDGSRIWLVEAADGPAVLSIELYEAFGAPTAPGVVEMTPTETDYATCGTCLVLRTGCVPHDDHFHCARTLMPRAEGELRVHAIGDKVGDDLAGELRGLVFREVTIGADFATTPVDGGQALRLDAWAFTVALDALDDGDEECSGHGHMHGDHCHCDPGYRVDPADPTRCIPQ